MAVRASWTEMDDGVLWRVAGSDVVAGEVAAGSPADRAGRAGRRHAHAGWTAVAGGIAERRGAARCTAPRAERSLTYSVLRMQGSAAAARHHRRSGPGRRARAVLRPGRRRNLLAAGRRRGPAPASRPPGHPALLLAEHRLLRDAGVLLQRPPRRRSTGCSTGATSPRGCCCRRCSCTSRWCFPERSNSWVRSDSRAPDAAADLHAGGAARRRGSGGGAARRLAGAGALGDRRA